MNVQLEIWSDHNQIGVVTENLSTKRTLWNKIQDKLRFWAIIDACQRKLYKCVIVVPFFDLKKLVWLHTASCLMHSSQGKTREEVWEEGLVLPPTKLHWYTILTAINYSTIYAQLTSNQIQPTVQARVVKTKSVFSQEMRNYKNEN